MTVLLALLSFAAAALFVSRPWEDTVLGPELSVAPRLDVGLGDSAVVAGPRSPEMTGDAPGVAGTVLVATPPSRPARPVGTVAPAPGIATAPAVAPAEPVPSPAPAPAPAPATPPAAPVTPPPQSPPPVAPNGMAPVVAAAPAAAPAGTEASTGGKAATGVTPPTAPEEGVCDAGEAPRPALSIEIGAGEEYALAIPFCIEPSVYGEPGADNSIVRIAGEAEEDPTFGLQLWDFPASGSQSGGRGLWASGEAMGGERFLASVEEGTWHRLAVYLELSGDGEDLYVICLDDEPIDAGIEIGLLSPGSEHSRLEVGFGGDEGVLPGAGLHLGSVGIGPIPD